MQTMEIRSWSDLKPTCREGIPMNTLRWCSAILRKRRGLAHEFVNGLELNKKGGISHKGKDSTFFSIVSMRYYKPSKLKVSKYLVVNCPERNPGSSINRMWKGMVVLIPSITNSCNALFMRVMTSSLDCPLTITLAIMES